jgi:hypothetical protein
VLSLNQWTLFLWSYKQDEMLVMADKTKNEMLVAPQRVKDNLSTVGL